MPAHPASDLLIYDVTDPSKEFWFDASTITTGTRRTYIAPNGDGTLALLESDGYWTGINQFATLVGIDYVSILQSVGGNSVVLSASGLTAQRIFTFPDAPGILALTSDIPASYTFASLTSKPTTIGGYGITDYNSLGDARWSLLAHTHTFASLTSKPTTIGGYGVTDFNSLGDARWSLLAHTHTFASLTSPPTTIAGYGITNFNSLGDARWGQLAAANAWTGNNTWDATSGVFGFKAAVNSAIFLWINSDLSGNDIQITTPATIAAPVTLSLPNVDGAIITTSSTSTLSNKTLSSYTMGSNTTATLNTTTGTKIGGAANQKLGFHGATAVIQRAGAAQAALATTAATTGSYGHTQAQADGIITLLNEIRAALVEKGLIKGAA